MTTRANLSTSVVTGLAAQLAVLEMSADEACYQADCKTRDAARAAQRQLQEEQIRELREKADMMRLNAFVDGGMTMLAGAAQGLGAYAQYDANMAKVAQTLDPDAQLAADACSATSNLLSSETKVNDLVFNGEVTDHDTASLEYAHRADASKDLAERANTAAQRIQNQSDQKLALIEEMLRSDADLMHMLIRRS